MGLTDISQIRPYLYLTSYTAIYTNIDKLKEFGITHAVDATNNPQSRRLTGVEYFVIEVEDDENSNLKNYFEQTIEFIKNAKDSGGKIIVYCAAGISRSASIVLVYLMVHENMSLKDVYYEVVSIRRVISPNSGFWRQMIEYEKEKTGQTTVKLLPGTKTTIPDVYLTKCKAVRDLNNLKTKYSYLNFQSNL